MNAADIEGLKSLLRERIATIADHGWRDRDPEAHLLKLKEVSEAIFAAHARHKGALHPRLEHFLSGCSYDKALAFLEGMAGGE